MALTIPSSMYVPSATTNVTGTTSVAGTPSYVISSSPKSVLGSAAVNTGSVATHDQIVSNNPTGPSSTDAQAVAAARASAAKQRQADAILASIGALDTVRQNSYNTARSQYDKNLAGYATAEATDLANYNKQVAQNEGNLASDRQAALLQAAQSGRGLRSVLAALGALSGTGSILADRAITSAANQDIGEAQDTFDTNSSNLTNAYNATEQEQRQRRSDAEAAYQNELSAADLARAQGRQSAYTSLADLYGIDTVKGADYASQATSLYPEIATASRSNVGGYAAPSALYSEQAIADYQAGVNPLTVSTDRSNSSARSNLTAYTGNQRKRDEEVA